MEFYKDIIVKFWIAKINQKHQETFIFF